MKKYLLICKTYIPRKNQIVAENDDRARLETIRQSVARINPADQFEIVPSAGYRIETGLRSKFAVKI